MATIRVTLSYDVEVPDGAEVGLGGEVLYLPDGASYCPWISWERNDRDDLYKDQSSADMDARGVRVSDATLYLERSIAEVPT